MTTMANTCLMSLREWLPALIGALQRESPVVRIALAEVRGSAPREAGVGMLVGQATVAGTIGGGQLEWQALAAARSLLAPDAPRANLQRYVLGADVGQCCGGVVQVWTERFDATDLDWLRAADEAAHQGNAVLVTQFSCSGLQRHVIAGAHLASSAAAPQIRITHRAGDEVEIHERLNMHYPPLWLYGAGHVGQALARILVDLPLKLTWIDSRSRIFPPDVPASVRLLCSADPVASVEAAPAACRFLIMTHSHTLDFALCRAVLTRNDFAWAGLIGSKSKAARFRSRLSRAHVAAEAIARLVCPIGVKGIDSKWPTAIAVGVAAELLQDISGAGIASRGETHDPQPCTAANCAGCDVP